MSASVGVLIFYWLTLELEPLKKRLDTTEHSRWLLLCKVKTDYANCCLDARHCVHFPPGHKIFLTSVNDKVQNSKLPLGAEGKTSQNSTEGLGLLTK